MRTSGMEKDWPEVFKKELPRVYNFFRYRVGDDMIAEDLAAETFERAWKSRNGYCSDKGNTSSWILGIARIVASNHFRHLRNIEIQQSMAREIGDCNSVELEIEERERIRHLTILLSRYSDREQDLIALKYGAGMTNRAIAKVIGLTETNVGTILHRVVKKLRKEWEDLK